MISGIERDDLHREILRTQGHLTSRNDRVSDRSRDNRLRTWQDMRFDYDPWGNLVTKRVGRHLEQRFEYDAENHLIHATTYRDGNLQSEARYHYDSLGRRSAKVVEQDGKTKRTAFLWQGLRLLEERSGDQPQLYVYEPNSYAPLASIDGTGDDTRLYYFHSDPIGTPLDVTDEAGQMVWQASYKAWGEVETYHTEAIEQNLRFQGQYFDAETGLHYNTFRYYDPGVGRFVTQDPIGLAGGLNLYQYAENPNIWIDPWGLTTSLADPNLINFSQSWVSPNNYAEVITHKGWIGDPLNVIVRDGQMISFDNRRLDAARSLEMEKVPISIVEGSAPYPKSTTGKTWDTVFDKRLRENGLGQYGTSERPAVGRVAGEVRVKQNRSNNAGC